MFYYYKACLCRTRLRNEPSLSLLAKFREYPAVPANGTISANGTVPYTAKLYPPNVHGPTGGQPALVHRQFPVPIAIFLSIGVELDDRFRFRLISEFQHQVCNNRNKLASFRDQRSILVFLSVLGCIALLIRRRCPCVCPRYLSLDFLNINALLPSSCIVVSVQTFMLPVRRSLTCLCFCLFSFLF